MSRTIRTSAPGSVPARQAAAVQLGHRTGRSSRSTYRRLMRRQGHSSGSVVAITVASVIIAGCLYTGTELVLELTGRQPLLAAPSAVVRTVSQVNQIGPAILFTVGVLMAVPILVLVLVALLPGRLARHEAGSHRPSVTVDDETVPAGPASADVPASRHKAAVRVDPETRAVTNRFTAAKAIAEAIAYDALPPRTVHARRLDTLPGAEIPRPRSGHTQPIRRS